MLEIKKEQKQPRLGTMIGIWLLYWLLNMVGSIVSLIPQIVASLGSEPAISDVTSISAQIESQLYIPWYQNAIQFGIILLIIFLSKKKGMTFFSRDLPKLKEVGQVVLASIGLIVLITALEFMLGFLQPEFNTVNQIRLEQLFALSNPVTMFIMIVILAPLGEEIVFRGFFMKYFFANKPRLGFLVCAVAFTLVHQPTDFFSFLVYFVMSLGFGVIYYRTQRIEAVIFAHFLNNLFGFFLML